jgi:hypothetical protein
MLPFTPRRRDNLAAWLVARSDGEHYGRLSVFEFPKQKLVFGPRQVVARIAQDQVISPQITLWNQQGSQVIWGTLLVIPIGESLIYVRPLYLRASGGRIPELTRVIVAYNNQIVMEPTLDAALARLFGGTPPAPAPETEQVRRDLPDARPASVTTPVPNGESVPLDALAVEARGHYDAAIERMPQHVPALLQIAGLVREQKGERAAIAGLRAALPRFLLGGGPLNEDSARQAAANLETLVILTEEPHLAQLVRDALLDDIDSEPDAMRRGLRYFYAATLDVRLREFDIAKGHGALAKAEFAESEVPAPIDVQAFLDRLDESAG